MYPEIQPTSPLHLAGVAVASVNNCSPQATLVLELCVVGDIGDKNRVGEVQARGGWAGRGGVGGRGGLPRYKYFSLTSGNDLCVCACPVYVPGNIFD